MKYNSPPIIEAIFDVRIDGLNDFSVEKVEDLQSLIIGKYPNKKKQVNYIGKIEFKDEMQVANESNSQVRGFVFSDEKNIRQVQFRIDGFTFNMLRPYSEWDDFSSESFRLWKVYCDSFKPTGIGRIALRYINKIEIPMPFERFQDYVVNMPPIPRGLPQVFSNFFMQTEIPCDTSGTSLILTETIEKPTNVLPFILDIDCYKIGKISMDIDLMMAEFNSLRLLKNKTFESCISDRTRDLFS